MAHKAAQQGSATGGKLHLCGKTRTWLTASTCCSPAQKLCCRLSPALVTISKRGEIFSKRLARTSGVGTAKAVRLNQQYSSVAQTGKAVNAASKPAMSCRCLGLTRGTSVAFACRNERDGDVLALMLDCLYLTIRKLGEEIRPGHRKHSLCYRERISRGLLYHSWSMDASKRPLPELSKTHF